ncbi:MAG: hypothetical protein AAFN74_18665 [Myxococcota bacterium]
MPTVGSILLAEERFRDADPGFLSELYLCTGAPLKRFGQKWISDSRPFARQALIRYIQEGCDHPGHRPLVKKLFKEAEARQDDELMRHFMVVFDRLVTSQQQVVSRYSWRTQRVETELRWVRRRTNEAEDTFSIHTRLYLQRRAYRYFRRMGYRASSRYVENMLAALKLYADSDTEHPRLKLDRWSLFHILYWQASFPRDNRGRITLRPGIDVRSIDPAPRFADEWRRQSHVDALLRLMAEAKNADVRAWVRAWLQSDPAQPLRAPALSRIWPLLRSPYIDAQEWSAELVAEATDMADQPLATWVELLKLPNAPAAEPIAQLAARWLAPERLPLDVAVDIIQAAQAPIAALVLGWIRRRETSKADLPILIRLGETTDPAARLEAVDWLVEMLGVHPFALLARELLDSPHEAIRERTLRLINTHYVGDPRLAVALIESPFADVRDATVKHLEQWVARIPATHTKALWARTLLSVRNGGRAKQAALRQIAHEVLKNGANADETLPLLAMALRSVRERERRGALAAIARIAHDKPELIPALQAAVPELKFEGPAS